MLRFTSATRPFVPFAILGGLAAFAGCSGPVEPASVKPASVEHTTQSASALSTSATVTIALPVNVEQRVHLHVTPLSVCRLTADGIVLASDVNGNLHFNMKATSEDSGTLVLTCSAKDGTTTTYNLAVSGTQDATAIAQTQTDMAAIAAVPSGTPLPALTGDPDSYDNKYLWDNGYGIRPDAKKWPADYAKWRNSVTNPGVFIPLTSSVEVPISNGPNEELVYNGGPGQGGWSGALDFNFSGDEQMTIAVAEFDVPQAFAESNIGNFSTASTWAGLGGWGTQPLWQTGVHESTQTELFIETSAYHAWWQLWPTTSENDTYSVNNGDDVAAEVWIGDITNGCSPSTIHNPNAYLCVWLHDYSSNQTTSGYWTANNAATWPNSFGMAEMIQEWSNGGSQDYAQFNAFNFIQNWDATDDTIQEVGATTSLFMTQIGSPSHSEGGSCMANSSGTCTDSGGNVRVWWNSHQ
jgi:hypothetical protein